MIARFLAPILVLLALLLPAASHAQDIATSLQPLASSRFEDIERGITELARSGHPRAAAIITAAGEGRLLVRAGEPGAFVKLPDGSLVEAATGTAATVQESSLKPVRLNNRVRRAIQAALGELTLLHPDASRRLEAANAVFRSRDAEALPALEQALVQEQDARVREAMAQARAAIVLTSVQGDEAAKLAAVTLVAGRGNQDALALLRSVPATAPPAVREAAATAIAGIEQRLAWLARGQDVVYGISLGSVLLLAAIGLAITFGVMGVINMAHGEMVMLGAYTTFVIQEFCRTTYPGLLDYSLIAAVPLAFLVAGAVGVAVERSIIRFLYGRPLETLLATWGLSLILQQAVRSIFGPNNREVSTPSWMSGSMELVAGLNVTMNRLVIVGFCLAVFASLLLLIRYARFGLEMRAVTQNRRMAASMGIRTAWVDAFTFGLGSGIAGVAGVALSQIDNVSPNLGQSYIIDSFLVVVFGGVGNLWGTLTGAMALGIANKLLEPFAGAVLGKIILLVAIILFIQKRPRGLFALKGRAVEA